MTTSHGPKSDWRPLADTQTLRARAELLRELRAFFSARGVLEVETPQLVSHATTDTHLASFATRFSGPGAHDGQELYLSTSPELAMKRLLAAGSGPIFQICRAFRNGEKGRRHNPEFTILEWYRPGLDHIALMAEIEELLAVALGVDRCDRITYQAVFEEELGVSPHQTSVALLEEVAADRDLSLSSFADVDEGLQFLLAEVIEPSLGIDRPIFVYDYPVSQAALARIRSDTPPVAERFEVYFKGVELANGFHELADAEEQRRRFEDDRASRERRGLPIPQLDEAFLDALDFGLPQCAGVALGLDRLLMLQIGADTIEEVLAFPLCRA